MFEIHRTFYNKALTERMEAWEKGVSIGLYDQTYQIKGAREDDQDLAWCNHNSLNRTMRRLDKSYRNFFRRCKEGATKKGHPRYKSRKAFASIEYTYNNGMRLKDDRLYVQNIGDIRMFYHRAIPEGARIKTGILKGRADFAGMRCYRWKLRASHRNTQGATSALTWVFYHSALCQMVRL